MSERIPMNSKSLQEHFPEVYRDFFSKCPVVVSAGGSFWWAGEHVAIRGGVGMMQKIPLRCYVGLGPISQNKINFSSDQVYDTTSNSFINFETGFTKRIDDEIIKLIKIEFKEEIRTKLGLNIYLLLEMYPSVGLNSSGSLSVALSLALNKHFRCLNYNEILEWSKIPTEKLIKNKLFERIFRLAWKIESIIHGGASSGACCFAAMISADYPIVYFSEERGGKGIPYQGLRFPSDIEDDYRIIDKIPFWGFKLEDLFDKALDAWPFDFGLIYSGEYVRTDIAIKSTEEFKNHLIEASNWTKSLLEKMGLYYSSKIISLNDGISLRDLISESKYNRPWRAVLSAISTINMKILWTFYELFKHFGSEEVMKNLFLSLNSANKLLNMMNLSSPTIDYIRHFLQEEARKRNALIACKSTGGAKGGDVLFAFTHSRLKEIMFNLVDKMRVETNMDIQLDYASWLDGIGGEGIKIEQDIEEKIYSSFVSHGTARVNHLNKQGNLHIDLYTLEEFENLKKEADILFDAVNEEIYIKGQRLTSKEIHSSATTIEIIKILLNNLGKEIRNDQLPSSSYTRDRNELQSKIIGPLTKVFSKKITSHFPISIHGGLIDFFVKLDQPDFDIYVLEKIF